MKEVLKTTENRPQMSPAAKESHPACWSGNTRNWQPIGAVTLIPEGDSIISEHELGNQIQQLAT